jgi:hypothetical protein
MVLRSAVASGNPMPGPLGGDRQSIPGGGFNSCLASNCNPTTATRLYWSCDSAAARSTTILGFQCRLIRSCCRPSGQRVRGFRHFGFTSTVSNLDDDLVVGAPSVRGRLGSTSRGAPGALLPLEPGFAGRRTPLRRYPSHPYDMPRADRM